MVNVARWRPTVFDGHVHQVYQGKNSSFFLEFRILWRFPLD